MNVALRKTWTQESFFAWAQGQDARYEFDGFRPVAMTGGTAAHNQVTLNLQFSLKSRLRGKACKPFGLDAGVETVDGTVRYPDALVTCSKVENGAYLVPGVVVVFEVANPSPRSVNTDRLMKVREYAAVPSIRRYVIVESSFVGLTVMERKGGEEPWTMSVLTLDGILVLPEIVIQIPVVEIYEDLDFSEAEDVAV